MGLALEVSHWVTCASLTVAVAYFVREYTRLVRWWQVSLGRALVVLNLCLALHALMAGFTWMECAANAVTAAAVSGEVLALKSLQTPRGRALGRRP